MLFLITVESELMKPTNFITSFSVFGKDTFHSRQLRHGLF